MCWAPSPPPWSWALLGRQTWLTFCPLPLSPRASAMNGAVRPWFVPPVFDSRLRELDSILLSSAAEDNSSREQREEL